MAKVLIFDICLMLLLSRVESCFIPGSLYVLVPQTIPAGYQITKVAVADCDTKSLHFISRDPSFTVSGDGAVVAVSPVSVAARGRTFSVWAQDNSGPESEMEVHLVHSTMHERQREQTGKGFLKRTKRRWSPPPFNIIENDKGPYPKEIEKIVSDSEAKYPVYYTLSGPGYNEAPVGVFSFDGKSGMLSVLKEVDREAYPYFILTTRVFDITTNVETDLPLDIRVDVDDENDNYPQFKYPLEYNVFEQCKAGTVVGMVEATDRDKPGTLHVKIRYTLLTGLDLFAIHPNTGVITTVTNTLDREVKDKHMVVVQIKDWDGAAKGLATTGTATISLSDINDNPPTFKKTSYEVNVKENESEKLVLRIPVDDKDLINTPNWKAKFVITKGNENGNFRIDTDPKTNEGLLYISKPLDHEKAKNVKLEIMARNEADLNGTVAQWLSIPVDVTVSDIDEGPEFTAPTIRFTVKENTPNDTLIGSYTAVDPETKSSAGIKYYKVTDPGSWISVDRNTGELRVANTIDRESELVDNGIYNITMKAVDASSKTGTGTVIIQVEDDNDNKPMLPTTERVLCEKEGELSSLVVVAEDLDQSPYSSPFIFTLVDDPDGKWSVKRFNDTAATLQQMKELPTGVHKVTLDVKDLQGVGEKQTVRVRICQCRNGACLTKPSSVSLGPLALLAMLLPLFLLLLLGILLALFCVTKKDKLAVDDTEGSGGILLASNTEAPGEEVDSSLIIVPSTGVEQAVKGSAKGALLNAGWIGNKSSSTIGGQSMHENGLYKSGAVTSGMQDFYSSGQYDSQYATQQFSGGHVVGSGVGFDNRHLIQDSAFLHTWQTNGCYIDQKLTYLGTEEDGRYADDIIHSYGFEGVGSAAGSVGCCSNVGDEDNLDFLNTLGPKFKTLAGICTKT
ncbi:desmocollin 2-like protein isoform X1 [Scomber japonicus]|uniref:desmocollin 2-like protein isoform X1 n=1 Tax=Scomber japonicus TaxID=13676 RepID=UPI002305EBF6|nr:desmocollin 2-like protein isoform X1 [Scomber japonicus]